MDSLRVIAWLAKRVAYATAPLRLLFWYAAAKGLLLSLVSPERHRLEQRLSAVFGTTTDAAGIRRLTRRHFVYLQKRSLVGAQLSRCARSGHCRVEGLDHLDFARSQGNGVILLTAHFGYGRLIKHVLRWRQYPAWLVGPKDPYTNGTAVKGFTRFGSFVYLRCLRMPHFSPFHDNDLASTLNVRPLVQVLRRNEILVMTVDGVRALKMVPVSILGQTVPFASGAVSLALATGAMVLPTVVVDSGPATMDFTVILEEPLPLESTDDRDRAVSLALERVARVVESYVLRYPHLYSWSESDSRSAKASMLSAADRYHRGH